MFSPIMQMMKSFLIVLVITLSTISINIFGMTIGMLVSSIDLITNLFSPIENLGMELQTIQKSMAAIERINQFFKLSEDDEKNCDLNNCGDDLILMFDKVTYSYDDKENVIENFKLKLQKNDRLILQGRSGSGKSTLLEALAVAHGFNPEGGTKNYVFSTHDTHSELCDAIRIAKGYRKEKWGYFLRAESFYNVATQEEEYADITHPSAKYHEKSHGESFLALAQNNMNPNGLYLFDEPEAALSPQRQLTLLMQIYRCAKEGAQFIIVTHSPILLGIPDADIYCFDNGRIHLCEYEDTESYQVTEMFINNRQMLLDRLLTD